MNLAIITAWLLRLQVCGDGHGQLGDGVVPSCCAHLEVRRAFQSLLKDCIEEGHAIAPVGRLVYKSNQCIPQRVSCYKLWKLPGLKFGST